MRLSECGWVLTGFHPLDLDIVSFGRVVHLDGRHVTACIDLLTMICRPLESSYLQC